MLRKVRPMHVGVGAAMLAIPGSAVALAAGQADAQSAIQITLKPRHVAFGRAVTVTGNATTTAAGQTLALQFASAGGSSWQTVSTRKAGSAGGFRFTATGRRSGLIRVLPAAAAGGPQATAASVSASPAQPLTVAARFALARQDLAVAPGQRAHVRGRLLPALGGRQVRLVTRRGHGWQTLARGRTGPHGGFDLPVSAAGSGRRWLRVVFAGDQTNAGAQALAGSVASFHQDVASWYDDGGATACGFHAGYGVANRTLPCGTRVTFRYGGHEVTATVDDRGPFVGGRNWDLNQNTAHALGFDGVGTVWVSF